MVHSRSIMHMASLREAKWPINLKNTLVNFSKTFISFASNLLLPAVSYRERKLSQLLKYRSFFILDENDDIIVGKLSKVNEAWVFITFDGVGFHSIYDKITEDYPSLAFQIEITDYFENLNPSHISFDELPQAFGKRFEKIHSLKKALIEEKLLSIDQNNIRLYSFNHEEDEAPRIKVSTFSGNYKAIELDLYLQYTHYHCSNLLLEHYPSLKYFMLLAALSGGYYSISQAPGLLSNRSLLNNLGAVSSLALVSFTQQPWLIFPSLLAHLPLMEGAFDCGLISQRYEIESTKFLCSAEQIVTNNSKIAAMVNTYENIVISSGPYVCNDLQDNDDPNCSGLYPALLNCSFSPLKAANFLINRANAGVQRCYYFYDGAITSIPYAENAYTQLAMLLSLTSQHSAANLSSINVDIHRLFSNLNATSREVSTNNNEILKLHQLMIEAAGRIGFLEEGLSKTKKTAEGNSKQLEDNKLEITLLLILSGLTFSMLIFYKFLTACHEKKDIIKHDLKKLERNIEKIKLYYDLLLVLTNTQDQEFLYKLYGSAQPKGVKSVYRKLYYNSHFIGFTVRQWDKYWHNLKTVIHFSEQHKASISSVLSRINENFLPDENHFQAFASFRQLLSKYEKEINDLLKLFDLPQNADLYKIDAIAQVLIKEFIPLAVLADSQLKNLLQSYRAILNLSTQVTRDIERSNSSNKPQALVLTAAKQARAAFLVFEEKMKLLIESRSKLNILMNELNKVAYPENLPEFYPNSSEAVEKEIILKETQSVLTELQNEVQQFMAYLGATQKKASLSSLEQNNQALSCGALEKEDSIDASSSNPDEYEEAESLLHSAEASYNPLKNDSQEPNALISPMLVSQQSKPKHNFQASSSASANAVATQLAVDEAYFLSSLRLMSSFNSGSLSSLLQSEPRFFKNVENNSSSAIKSNSNPFQTINPLAPSLPMIENTAKIQEKTSNASTSHISKFYSDQSERQSQMGRSERSTIMASNPSEGSNTSVSTTQIEMNGFLSQEQLLKKTLVKLKIENPELYSNLIKAPLFLMRMNGLRNILNDITSLSNASILDKNRLSSLIKEGTYCIREIFDMVSIHTETSSYKLQ